MPPTRFLLPAIVEVRNENGTFWGLSTPADFFGAGTVEDPIDGFLFGLRVSELHKRVRLELDLSWDLSNLSSCRAALFDTRKAADSGLAADPWLLTRQIK